MNTKNAIKLAQLLQAIEMQQALGIAIRPEVFEILAKVKAAVEGGVK